MYWHWHSIHNACETYWKGLLSHDLEENAVYREACCIGRQFRELSPSLVHLKKENKTAIMVSNEALSALNGSPSRQTAGNTVNYNDVVRWIYDALYEMNIECDFVSTDEKGADRYDMLFVPALYPLRKNACSGLRIMRPGAAVYWLPLKQLLPMNM